MNRYKIDFFKLFHLLQPNDIVPNNWADIMVYSKQYLSTIAVDVGTDMEFIWKFKDKNLEVEFILKYSSCITSSYVA